MSRVWTVALLIGMVVLLSSSTGYAQIAFAQLNGTVKDSSGAVMPKASLKLRETNTNRSYSAFTNESGIYIFANLPPGRYDLTAESSGFSKFSQSGILLTVGQSATIDVAMQVSGRGEEITVSGEAPPVEPTRTEVSQVVGVTQIQNLPISGRQFIDFALLTPGVAAGRTSLGSTVTEPETTRVSFGGQRDLNNNVTVDGAENVNMITGSQRATPSQEAVREFRVVNNTFGSEYGRALGGFVNIVTKSGTNEFHGSLYEYFRNSSLDARSILTLPGFKVLRQNQFGATLGGPLKKDRTFFFANYEGQRRGESPNYPTVLVDNLSAINTVKRGLGLTAENLSVLRTGDSDNGFIKVDQQLAQKHSLFVRYGAVDSRNSNLLVGETLDGGGLGGPSSGRNGLLRDQSLVGNLTSQLTSNTVNLALFQYARRSYGFKGVTNEPNLDLPNLLLFGHNFGAFDLTRESRVQLGDTVSWVRGKHYAKFGAETNYVRDSLVWPGFTPARIIFPTLEAFLGQPPFGSPLPVPFPVVFFWGSPVGKGPIPPAAPTLPTNWQFAFAPDQKKSFETGLNHNYWGFFGQDQWRITPKLALNYGVRYDFETGLGALVNGDYNNFQPRIALAYSPDSKTVIRAGYGIFADKFSLTFFYVSLPERSPQIAGLPVTSNMRTGTFLLNNAVGPEEAIPAFFNLIRTGSFPPNLRRFQGGGVVDPNSRTPYSEQASFQIDREVVKGTVLGAGYLFVAGHKLVRPQDLNIGPPIGKLPNGKDRFGFGKVDPDAGIFYYTEDSSNTGYHGLTLNVTQRYRQYLNLNANYTLSKTLDDTTFATFISTPENRFRKDLDRGLSNQDVRHRFVLDFSAEGPKGTLLRDFLLSSIVTVQSPRSFSLFVGFDANEDGNPVTDRVGLSARNTYRGANLRTVDLRIARFIPLKGERTRAELVAEFFNLFNRVNVNEVNNLYGAPEFLPGPQPRSFGDGVKGPIPSFGTPKTVFNPRQIQFALKITF